MVERLQEILNSKLDMVSKMEEIKKLLKEFHEQEDIEVLFNLLIKKSIIFKSEYKVQELEILALRELLVERIESQTPNESQEFKKYLTIKSLENQMKLDKVKVINSSDLKEDSTILIKQNSSYMRAMYDYSENNKTKEIVRVAENEFNISELKRIKQELDIINLYKTIVDRKINKDKKNPLKN